VQSYALSAISYEEDDVMKLITRFGVNNFSTLLGTAKSNAPSTEAHDKTWSPNHIDDQVALIFVLLLLGFASPPLVTGSGRNVLKRYLVSPVPIERWVSAFSLARLHDKESLSTLLTMLTEFMPQFELNDHLHPIIENLFNLWRPLVPTLLMRWGEPAIVIPALRHTLIKTLQIESAIARPSAEADRATNYRSERSSQPYSEGNRLRLQQEPWLSYQQRLVYAAGHLGSYGILTGLAIPIGIHGIFAQRLYNRFTGQLKVALSHPEEYPLQLMLWRVEMILGAIGTDLFQDTRTLNSFADHREVARAVELELATQFGLTEDERQRAMNLYEEVGYLSRFKVDRGVRSPYWKDWD